MILSAYGRLQRSNDAAFAFEQEANFWYLCGIEDPDWQLIFDGTTDTSWLIMPDVDEVHRIFDGGLSAEEAKRISGVDHVVTAREGGERIALLTRTHPLVYSLDTPPHSDHYNFSMNPLPAKHWSFLERTFERIQDCRKELAILRSLKQPDELAMIQKAVNATIAAFDTIHSAMSTYKNEFEIEADFMHSVRRAGASGVAYDSIVAAGLNACTLHYGKNHASIRSRQLTLMDMGAKVGGYAADISRTYAKGEPTRRQREVHSAVETAHHRIIALLEPMLMVEEYQRHVDSIMSEALESIGLGSGEESLRRYFPHAVSHGLGIDVHDSLGGPKFLQEGMVLTVEPGIYIPEETIGVRIEDDIAVTAKGHKNLSGSLSTGL